MKYTLHELLSKQPILLYDGECLFCNKTLHFYLNHEKKPATDNSVSSAVLHFAPLQSDAAKQLKAYFEIDETTDSIILIKHHSAYIKSCAALRLSLYMKGLWPLLICFVIIPPFIRNKVYDIIARNRKKFFGRSSQCRLFTKEESARLLT